MLMPFVASRAARCRRHAAVAFFIIMRAPAQQRFLMRYGARVALLLPLLFCFSRHYAMPGGHALARLARLYLRHGTRRARFAAAPRLFSLFCHACFRAAVAENARVQRFAPRFSIRRSALLLRAVAAPREGARARHATQHAPVSGALLPRARSAKACARQRARAFASAHAAVVV